MVKYEESWLKDLVSQTPDRGDNFSWAIYLDQQHRTKEILQSCNQPCTVTYAVKPTKRDGGLEGKLALQIQLMA